MITLTCRQRNEDIYEQGELSLCHNNHVGEDADTSESSKTERYPPSLVTEYQDECTHEEAEARDDTLRNIVLKENG